MKTALSAILGIPLLLPLFGGHHQLSRTGLEHALARQMNAGRAVAITKHVSCRPSGEASSYRCTLTSVNGSRAHAIVVVSGDTWRAEWTPLQG
jgi:hypothetical protein